MLDSADHAEWRDKSHRTHDMYGDLRIVGAVSDAPKFGSEKDQVRASKALNNMGQGAFKRFILFVLDNDKGSQVAIDSLKGRPTMMIDTHIEEVSVLKSMGRKPTWLTAVPCLVQQGQVKYDKQLKKPVKESTRAFFGSDAIQRIVTWHSSDPIARLGRRLQKTNRNGFSNGVRGTNGALMTSRAWHNVKGGAS